MKTRHLIIAAMAATLLTCGCSRSDNTDTRPLLCVSIEPQRKMLEELAGDDYRVVSMLRSGADPETYEASTTQRVALGDADAYFIVGTLPFERRLAASQSDVPVYDTSRGITLADGASHGSGSEGDPHVWASLRNGRQMAANMLDGLCRLNPDRKEEYKTRYERMARRLDSLDNATADRLAAGGIKAFAIWHPSLSYYARDYGLHQISAHAESKEMSPGELAEMIEEARADSVRVFFTEKNQGSRQASVTSGEIGARMAGINTLDYEWEQQLSRITDELTRR